MTLLEGNGRDRMEIFKTGFFFSSPAYTHHKKIHVIYIAVNWVLPSSGLNLRGTTETYVTYMMEQRMTGLFCLPIFSQPVDAFKLSMKYYRDTQSVICYISNKCPSSLYLIQTIKLEKLCLQICTTFITL